MFSVNELADMRIAQDAHMMDEGYRMVYSRTLNDFGEPVETWTAETSPLKCGIEMKSGSETDKQTMTIVDYDAVLRLQIGTVIEPKDHFKLTKQFGEDIADIEYGIVSPIQRGPSGIRILLNRIEL